MTILNLKIEGYRSLKDVTWVPGDLNVLIGPNGSGKSNLLRALELISISARGELEKHVRRAGGMAPIVWDGKSDGVEFSVRISPLEKGRDVEKDSLTYEMVMGRVGASAYRIDYELLGNYSQVKKGQRDEPFKMLERTPRNAVVFDEDQHGLTAPEESVTEGESLLSLASGPFTQNHLVPPFQRSLAQWSIYHDLHVNMDAPIRQSTIARHETRVDPDGQNLVSVLHTLYSGGDRDFKRDINMAMRAAFGDDFEELEFPPAADQRIQMKIRRKTLSRPQSSADLSDGTLRFLLLLAILASPDPAPLIAIDEPETGLHPSMLPIIAEYAVGASDRTQVILTTHSPQFLDAFRDVMPTTTVVKCADGGTALENVEGKQLERWLKEYSLGSLFRSGELEGGLAEDQSVPGAG